MNGRTTPRSIEEYLDQLRAALAGEDPALIQDALYDAEEHLRAESQANPGQSEADMLESIMATYGAPGEVADAYRRTEKQVTAALKVPARPPARTLLGRFFAVYTDSRAWLALFFMLLSLVTGIVYFTATVTGLSVSAGLMVLIIGVPFFLLFVGFTRVLALAEGRMIEAMLGTRMPRRPRYPAAGQSLPRRVWDMLIDRRTWTTMCYFLLMLPLGVGYFVIAVTGIAAGFALLVVPFAIVGYDTGLFTIEADFATMPSLWVGALSLLAGVLTVTTLLHVARLTGRLHGSLAKHLLVAPAG